MDYHHNNNTNNTNNNNTNTKKRKCKIIFKNQYRGQGRYQNEIIHPSSQSQPPCVYVNKKMKDELKREVAAKLPIELQERVWREVYDGVVATIAEKKPRISWKDGKSQRLKRLLQNEVGAYQIGHADFDAGVEEYYCLLCAHVNFPCNTCAVHRYAGKVEPKIFQYEFEPFYENEEALEDGLYYALYNYAYYLNWENPYDDEYIWDSD